MAGWWNKFFRNFSKEVKKEKIKTIKFSELENWLEEKKKAKKREVEKEAQPLVDDITHTLEELMELTLELKRKDLPVDIPKKARKIIQSSKPAFVKDLLKSLNLGGDLTLEKLQIRLPGSLNKIGRLLASKGRYLPLAFSDELGVIGKKANQLLREGEKLRSFSIKDKNLEQCLLQYTKIGQSQEELKDLSASQELVKQNLTKLHQRKEVLGKRLRGIEKSVKMKEFLQEQVRQEEIIQEKEKIELKLYSFLSPLKRPLKKFRKYLQTEGRGVKELQDYLDDPVNHFLHAPEEILLNLLNEIRGISLKIKLKSQDLTKVKEAYNQFNTLKKLKNRYFLLEIKKKEVEEKLLSFQVVKERWSLNQKINSVKREISREKEKLEKINNQISERTRKLPPLEKELLEKISKLAGRRMKIKF